MFPLPLGVARRSPSVTIATAELHVRRARLAVETPRGRFDLHCEPARLAQAVEITVTAPGEFAVSGSYEQIARMRELGLWDAQDEVSLREKMRAMRDFYFPCLTPDDKKESDAQIEAIAKKQRAFLEYQQENSPRPAA